MPEYPAMIGKSWWIEKLIDLTINSLACRILSPQSTSVAQIRGPVCEVFLCLCPSNID